MPAYLKVNNAQDVLEVTLSGMRGPEFSDALMRVKSIPGRRFNPDTKAWELPKDADTALRCMQMLSPVADAEVQVMVREHAAAVADALITKLPEDADLALSPSLGQLMRPYQRSAVAFFQEHPRSILADEMGTGKTFQALATVAEARARYDTGQGSPLSEGERDHPVLVVCPNAMRGTWHEEIRQWLDSDSVIIDGKNPGARAAQVREDAEYYIVNWEKLRLMPELASAKDYSAIIADEAHRAKNRKAQQTKALWKLKAPIQLALTGTPIMNSPDELWALLRWLRPEQYTGFWPFHYSYVDEYSTRYGTVMTGVKNADQLRFELADKLVRRTKRDVLKDLPPKTVQVIPVELDAPTRKLYQEVETALLLDVAKWLETQEEYTLEDLEGMPLDRLTGLVTHAAARITKLRQITSAYKVRIAEEIIRDNPGKPFVTFTWFVNSAHELTDRLSKGKPKLSVGRIAGDDDPDPVKDAFQNGELDQIVATISKGGTGLTLTRADTAIFVDEDWVPAINAQAEDRLHRIGQKEAVTILRLRATDTIDTKNVAPANRLKELIASQVLGDPNEEE